VGKLTVAAIEAMPEGAWLSDGPVLGDRLGSLVFRRKGGAIAVYLRYAIGRTSKVYRIGKYERTGKRGVSLAMARNEAARLVKLRREGATDLAVYFAAIAAEEQAVREARRIAEEAARAALAKAEEERQRFTLGKLAAAYLAHLEALAARTAEQGHPTAEGQRRTAGQVRSLFNNHLYQHKVLCAKPARDITSIEAAHIIRACAQAGHIRAPGQVRSYLRRAYALAIEAPLSGESNAGFLGFGLDSNPFAAVPAMAINARHRTLSDEDLAAYLRGLFAQGDPPSLALLLHSLTAGQRMQQLLRVTLGDVDLQAGTLRLWDSKGRRARPREHLVPLGPIAMELVAFLVNMARHHAAPGMEPMSIPLFIVTLESCYSRARAIGHCTPGDIRRTVETRLASLAISQDHRAQLLSHGLGGVQQVHYDRHSYGQEKRRAVELWERHLDDLMMEELKNTPVPRPGGGD
jgi:integrase